MCSNWWHQEASWLCAAHQSTRGILWKARHCQTKNSNKTIVFVFTFLFGHVHVSSELKSHEHTTQSLLKGAGPGDTAILFNQYKSLQRLFRSEVRVA